ncbi:MAG: hypothetical protein MUE68_07320 [Bacteroidetes bacterium]|jgi:hypothetical protein|nr:hypothetical protein [Bacteroidota bacterium]
MKTPWVVALLCVTSGMLMSQSVVDEIRIKTGEMGGRGKEWSIAGRAPETGILLEIAAAANPIAANVTNDLKPSPDWFLGFLVEVMNERTGAVVSSKKYEFMPRGGLMKMVDTLNLAGKGGTYRTVFRFETDKIGANTRAQVIRIQEGTIKTTVFDLVPKGSDPQAPAPKKRFRVD